MRASYWNALIDSVAYIGFVVLAATGLVLRYRLPPGSGGEHGGRGGPGSAERGVELLWGYSRHDWGAVHYWIALAILAVLAVHLVLHWRWILCMIRGKKSEASGRRLAVSATALVGVIVLAALPFLTATESTSRGALLQRSPAAADAAASPRADSKSNAFAELRGYNTLTEAAAAANVSVEELRTALNLDAGVSADARFSSFIHQQGLSIDDVRQMLAELSEEATADKRR